MSIARRWVWLYRNIRAQTSSLIEGLSEMIPRTVDARRQSRKVAPLAHTTRILRIHGAGGARSALPASSIPATRFCSIHTMKPSARHARPKRGLLSRPTLDEIERYRAHVDAGRSNSCLQRGPAPQVLTLVELGCHHEQQHQELLLTDILHLFCGKIPCIRPMRCCARGPRPVAAAVPLTYTRYDAGVVEIGHSGAGFAFDSEGPRHPEIRPAFRLGNRCVTNREWLEFMADGGYRSALLWLSDGWTEVQRQNWTMPLYWWAEAGTYFSMTLHGAQPLELDAPVSHISYFEADAFASWAGKRLPTEVEWESVAHSESAVKEISRTQGCCAPHGPQLRIRRSAATVR